MINKIYNLVPYLILTVVLTSFFVWLKAEETDNANEEIRHMNRRIEEWKESEDGRELNAPLVIDVRSPSEFALSHCEGAINIPYEKIKEEIFFIVLDRKTPLLIYSRSLRISDKAVEYLKTMDYQAVFSLNKIAAEFVRRDEVQKD